MARIPEITWFNKEKRLSETTAARRRGVAHREDNAAKYGTRKKKAYDSHESLPTNKIHKKKYSSRYDKGEIQNATENQH